jgi:hypothetical protein
VTDFEQAQCGQCGADMDRWTSTGHERFYHTPACRSKAWRSRKKLEAQRDVAETRQFIADWIAAKPEAKGTAEAVLTPEYPFKTPPVLDPDMPQPGLPVFDPTLAETLMPLFQLWTQLEARLDRLENRLGRLERQGKETAA